MDFFHHPDLTSSCHGLILTIIHRISIFSIEVIHLVCLVLSEIRPTSMGMMTVAIWPTAIITPTTEWE